MANFILGQCATLASRVLLWLHEGTALCRDGHRRQVQRENANRTVEAQEKHFTACGEELKQVEVMIHN